MGIQWLSLLVMFAITNKVYSTITLAADNEIPAFKEYFLYPLSGAIGIYKIAVISNLRENSKRSNGEEWISHMKRGNVILNNGKKTITVEWEKPNGNEKEDMEIVTKNSNENGRGFELTELVSLNGVLVSFDEATGVAYLYNEKQFQSWLAIKADSAASTQAMPIKWALVKDSMVYVGTNGVDNSNHVAKVFLTGEVDYEDWSEIYTNINKSRKNQDGSTLVHQSAGYANEKGLFYFLPRYVRSSDLSVKPQNVVFSVSKDFKKFEEKFTISEKHEDRSFTSLKVVPLSHDSIIIAIQNSENSNESYITAFDTQGIVYCKSSVISSNIRYNTVEFV